MSRSNKIKGLGFFLWLLSVCGVVTALYYQDRFFAVSDVPVAHQVKSNGIVNSRSEGEVRWTETANNQGFFDGDLVATSRASDSEIDFGKERYLKMWEDTQIKILRIRIGGDFTFLITLLRGSIEVKNCKGCPEFIVKSGDGQFRLGEGEALGLFKEAGKVAKKFDTDGPRPAEDSAETGLGENFLKDPPKLTKANGFEIEVADRDRSGRKVRTQYWTLRPIASLAQMAMEIPLTPPRRRPKVGTYTPLLRLDAPGGKGGKVYTGRGFKAQSIKVPFTDITGNSRVNRLRGGVKEYVFSFVGGAKTAIDKERSQSFAKVGKEFSIKTFGEYPGGPVTIGLNRWERNDARTVWIQPKKLIRPDEAPIAIHLVSSQDMPRFYPYFRGAEAVGRSRRGLHSANGVFVVRGAGVIAQLRGSDMSPQRISQIMRILKADFVFEGPRSAFYDTRSKAQNDLLNWIGALLDKGKVLYILKKKKLYPVSRQFIKTNGEVATFIDQQAKAIFLEKVNILDYQ